MKKKSLIVICISFMLFIALSSLALAQNKIGITMSKESFSAGENVAFTVSLYDAQNNLIDDIISIIIEDAEKTSKIENVVSSNKLVEVNLGENAKAEPWKITAKHQDSKTNEATETTTLFTIEPSGNVKFEIQGDKLIITNTGNSRYAKTLYIAIGDSIKPQNVDLDVGEKASFILIAPEGIYNIRVIADGKTQVEKGEVTLVGTGNVIGVLDESLTSGGSPVTGGVKPEQNSEDYRPMRNKNFVYVFLLVIIGSAVLLAIERRYRKKV